MLMGLPGAGKTTAAQILSKLTGAEHLSSDALRAELFPNPSFSQKEHDQLYAILNNRAETLLNIGRDVIYDANLNRHRHRQEKYDLCKKTGARSVLLWVKTPLDIAKTRASDQSRQRQWPKNETPERMFDRIASIIEPPTVKESHTVIEGINIDSKYLRKLLEIK